MKFLCLDKPAKKEGTPPTQQKMDQMGELIEVWMSRVYRWRRKVACRVRWAPACGSRLGS